MQAIRRSGVVFVEQTAVKASTEYILYRGRSAPSASKACLSCSTLSRTSKLFDMQKTPNLDFAFRAPQ